MSRQLNTGRGTARGQAMVASATTATLMTGGGLGIARPSPASGAKEILGKAVISGLIGGIAYKFLLMPSGSEGMVIETMLGEFAPAFAVGGTVAVGSAVGTAIELYAFSDATRMQIGQKLGAAMGPALSGVGTVIASALLMPGSLQDANGSFSLMEVLKPAALGAVSTMGGDYVYDNFIATMMR